MKMLRSIVDYECRENLYRETQPTRIPVWVKRELSDLLGQIDKSEDRQEIRHLIGLFRLMADPLTHGYNPNQSNKQIRMLNEHLFKRGYPNLQVPEY